MIRASVWLEGEIEIQLGNETVVFTFRPLPQLAKILTINADRERNADSNTTNDEARKR